MARDMIWVCTNEKFHIQTRNGCSEKKCPFKARPSSILSAFKLYSSMLQHKMYRFNGTLQSHKSFQNLLYLRSTFGSGGNAYKTMMTNYTQKLPYILRHLFMHVNLLITLCGKKIITCCLYTPTIITSSDIKLPIIQSTKCEMVD